MRQSIRLDGFGWLSDPEDKVALVEMIDHQISRATKILKDVALATRRWDQQLADDQLAARIKDLETTMKLD